MTSIDKALSKLPVVVLSFFYLVYLGYGYYNWINSPDSEYKVAQIRLDQFRQNNSRLRQQLSQAEEFLRNLDVMRAKIRQLVAQLDGSKGTLSSEINLSNFVRMITLEAKKLSLTIRAIKPEQEVRRDYYVEVPFSLSLRGAYVQILVFFGRISKLQQVIRVSDFSLKPSGSNLTKYVELDGTARLVAFRYLGTQADEIANAAVLREGSVDSQKSNGGAF